MLGTAITQFQFAKRTNTYSPLSRNSADTDIVFAPQGYMASGDGYTHRYDRIIADIPRKTKCVDDVALWDDSLETHWWRMIDYLDLMGRQGITLNPSKFQFAEKEISFAGFQITPKDVKPLPKYLDSIRSFPQPKGIADVRAWFGLVNQVSHYN